MTTTYHVHLYREMRLFFPGVVAATPEQAAERAAQLPDTDAAHIEDCEGVNLCALVDVDGDEDFSQSVGIDFEAGRRLAAPALLQHDSSSMAAKPRTVRSALEEIDFDNPEKTRRLLKRAIIELSATQETV